MKNERKVVILGGYGMFGRYISEQLAADGFSVVVSGRNRQKGQAFAKQIGADFEWCDLSQPQSLATVCEQAFLIINAAGPFNHLDFTVPLLYIEYGVHYVDLGDGRDYVAAIPQLHVRAAEKGVLVCVGASTSPALTAAMVKEIQKNVTRVKSVKVALNAGNKNEAGISTFASILSYAGSPVRVWHDSRWQLRTGWGEGEFVSMPDPAGRRRVQLCDVPDLELFPDMFAAESVTFKAGVELTVFNFALSALSLIRRIFPKVALEVLARPLVTLSGYFKGLGTLHGACSVWVTDQNGVEHSLAVVAPENGPRIPTAAAIIVSRQILESGGLFLKGAMPCTGIIEFEAFIHYLEQFGIFAVRGEGGIWLE